MQINWFTVIAQVINFLILVWLLKKYLYKPVMDAIDSREKKITSQLLDAEQKKQEAEKEHNEFLQKNKDFDAERTQKMTKATAEVEAERERLLKAAREEANSLRQGFETSLEKRKEKISKDIATKSKEEIFLITKKVLKDMASADMEKQMAQAFIKRLKELDENQLTELKSAFNSGTSDIEVISAFELPADLKNEISGIVKAIVIPERELIYKTNPDLVSGIELSANGYKFSWSISEYLKDLESKLSDTLKTSQE